MLCSAAKYPTGFIKSHCITYSPGIVENFSLFDVAFHIRTPGAETGKPVYPVTKRLADRNIEYQCSVSNSSLVVR